MTSPTARTLEGPVARILQAVGDAPAAYRTQSAALVLLVGLPGSGKSTFARRLAGQTGAAILESDALRRLLFGDPEYTPAENARLFAAVYAAAEELLSRGRAVIVDATNLLESDRLNAYRLSERSGVPLHILHFTVPSAVAEERLRRRLAGRDPLDASSAGPAVYKRMAVRVEPVRRAHRHVDTSDPEATEAVLEAMVQALRSNLPITTK